ncbi:MAG: hypothetical protein KAU95_03325, partial [Candidatus Aenigmarchaeota archaeon]|nr:hypothetical protein [Candidatus Aenigmarchaeota archaeon]
KRVGSRVELLESNRPELNERMSNMSEKIGELRSSLIDLDKNFNNISRDFSRISDISKELQPEKILKSLEKKQSQIEQNEAKVESVKSKISIMSGKFKEVSDTLEQVKGLKDIVSVADELNKKIRVVSDLKTQTEKTAGKMETLFYELKENLNEVRSTIGRSEANEDAIKEMLRTVDKMSLKLESLAKKQNLDDMRKELDNGLSEFRFDTDSKISKLVDTLKDVNEKMKNINTSKEDDIKKYINKKITEYSELYKNADRVIKEQVDKLQEQQKRELDDGLKHETENLDKMFSDKLTEYSELYKNADRRIKEHIDKIKEQIDKLPEQQKRKLDDRLKQETENLDKRFSDMELKLLGLSKNVDARIENRMTMKGYERKDEHLAAEIKKENLDKESVVAPKEKPVIADNTRKLVKYIETLIESGNYKGAREHYITLMSEYESHEKSDPYVLTKITEFHNKLK